jgi:hypothetical protein
LYGTHLRRTATPGAPHAPPSVLKEISSERLWLVSALGVLAVGTVKLWRDDGTISQASRQQLTLS